jgi:hypothetical protein
VETRVKQDRSPLDRPKAPRFRGSMRKVLYPFVALAVLFAVALGVAWSAIGVLDRPHEDELASSQSTSSPAP